MAHFPFSAFVSAFCAVTIGIFLLINSKQPKPYLDEIFHVPQAQKYCQYRFTEWDPKITTLPGLYLTTFAVLKTFAFFSKQELTIVCSALFLRLTNLIFFVGNIWILRKLVMSLNVRPSEEGTKKSLPCDDNFATKCSLAALVLASFPLLYFYTFLYYTDPGATFFVLLLYYLSLHGNHFSAALAGCVAILFRQTNVVWVVFTAGTTAARTLQPSVQKKLAGKSHGMATELFEFILSFFVQFTEMLKTLWAYGLVVLGFGAFVVLNGGIVVGDKASHEACLNFPQMFYLLGFTLFFSSSHLALPPDICNFLKSSLSAFKKPLYILGAFCVAVLMILLVYKFTYVHEYLLADNRHYPFYLWRKVYARHWSVRYVLIPVYMFSAWGIHKLLSSKQNILWQLVFFFCVGGVTVPQKLLEFRYFILPYVMFRLHMPLASAWRLFLELVLYLSVNAATIYLFLEKPFRWSHSPEEIQRFMW